MQLHDFEWDDNKDRLNQAKHGISFEEALPAFFDLRRLIFEDTGHSKTESRFLCIGKALNGVVTVRFTMRQGRIRVIGAGYWREGRRIYEEKNKIHG